MSERAGPVSGSERGRPRIVWLASYPKCGNTWLRFMLSTALFGPPEGTADVEARIPDIHRAFDQPPTHAGRIYLKSHFTLSDSHPMLDRTDRAIYIIRNPRDVVLSVLNYQRLTGEGDRAWTRAGYVKRFIRHGGDRAWLRGGFGTWAGHARSWRQTDRFPVLALRYEDLKADPRGGLVRMLAFLDVRSDPARVDLAVETSSFESMRAMEISESGPSPRVNDGRPFLGLKRRARDAYFVNQGRSGQSLDTIRRGLDARFHAAFGEDMRAFGYSS